MADGMPEPMSAARFAELADAYGGRIDRWPATERGAAQRFAAGEQGRDILASAAELDRMLDTYTVASPGAALQGRILEAADQRGPLQRRLLRWWEGLGLIGVGLAGAAAGVMAMSIMLAGPLPAGSQAESDAFYDQAPTVFGDIGRIANTTQEAQ